MAREVVVQVSCSRCARVESRKLPPNDPHKATPVPATPPMAFSCRLERLDGKLVELFFEDLCSVCIDSIEAHLGQVGKKIKGVSPERGKKEEVILPAPVREPVATATVPTGPIRFVGDTGTSGDNGSGAKKRAHP